MHYTVGNGEFDLFYQMTAAAVRARSVITPENCIAETEQLITAALYHRRPVYMAFPSDVARQPTSGGMQPLAAPQNDPASLESVVSAIAGAVNPGEGPLAFCRGSSSSVQDVTTCAELDAVLATAQCCRTCAYIDVVTDKYIAPPLAIKTHQFTKTAYKN